MLLKCTTLYPRFIFTRILFELSFCFIYHIYFLWFQILRVLIMRRLHAGFWTHVLTHCLHDSNWTHVVFLSLYDCNVRYAATPNSLVYFYVLCLFLLKMFTFALESWHFEVRYLKPINCTCKLIFISCVQPDNGYLLYPKHVPVFKPIENIGPCCVSPYDINLRNIHCRDQ